jgi:2-polyprenyl-3-methyl-5-hydroxy-6-metoxy-1,4-benzoquinol methylase
VTTTSPQSESVRRFFSGFAAQWDSLYGARRNVAWRAFDQAFRRDIYERFQLTWDGIGAQLSGATVLDIGCGSGVYCFEAARRGAARVVGIDIAEDMVHLAAAHAASERGGHVCEFEASAFPPDGPVPVLADSYDFAIVMGVMDYVADADAFLRAMRPLVRRRAMLSFPGQHWLRAPLREYRYRLLGRCEIYTYDEASIRQACLSAGFDRVTIRRLNHSGICYIVSADVAG